MVLNPSCAEAVLLGTDTRAFYIAALSVMFFFLEFVSGNLTLTGF